MTLNEYQRANIRGHFHTSDQIRDPDTGDESAGGLSEEDHDARDHSEVVGVLDAVEAQALIDAAIDTAGAFVGAIATRSTNLPVGSGGTPTPITLTDDTLDTHGFHDPAVNPSRFTIPAGLAGVYRMTAYYQMAANTSGVRRITLYVNGNAVEVTHAFAATTGIAATLTVTFNPVVLAVGDYVEAHAYQNSGGSLNIVEARVSIEYLGPVPA